MCFTLFAPQHLYNVQKNPISSYSVVTISSSSSSKSLLTLFSSVKTQEEERVDFKNHLFSCFFDLQKSNLDGDNEQWKQQQYSCNCGSCYTFTKADTDYCEDG